MVADFAAWVAAADTAMLAVTAVSEDGELDACLVGFHSQASIRPPRYVVWLSVANHTFRLATCADVLGVHLLGTDQRPLAARLGTVTADEHPGKLDGLALRRHDSGAMLLDACSAWFAGRVLDRFAGGDHHGFLLEPLAASAAEVTPLRLSAVHDLPAGHPA